MIRFIIFIVFSLQIICLKAYDRAVVIGKENMMVISQHVAFIEDESRQLQLPDVIREFELGEFDVIENKIFHHNPTNSSFWFKVTVLNDERQDIWFSAGDDFSIWYLDLYQPDSLGGYGEPQEIGALRSTDPIFGQWVQLVSGGSNLTTYYLRIESQFPLNLPFRIATMPGMIASQKKVTDIKWVFLGLMLAIIAYNLFLFLSTKENVFLYYLVYLLVLVIAIPLAQGDPFIAESWFWEFHITTQTVPMALAIFLFSTTYLQLWTTGRYFFWCLFFLLMIVIGAGILNVLFPNELSFLLTVIQPILLVNNLTLFISGVYVWSRGYKKARFFVLASFFLISGIGTFILLVNGILPQNMVTSNALYIGFSLEALMFGLALGDRLNILKMKNDYIQRKNLMIFKEQNLTLETLVREKTLELQTACDVSTQLNRKLVASNESLTEKTLELEKALNDRKEVQSQLIQSEKMAALGLLAAGVGHEINNPLNFIQGGVNAIEQHLREAGNNSEILPFLDTIKEGVKRSSAITRSLSRYSRQNENLTEPCNLQMIVDSCLNILHNELLNVVVETQFLPDAIVVVGNEGKLHQVVLNILLNACQAVDQSGEISISTTKEDESIILSIKDNGIGIKPQNQSKISDPFFTTKEPGKGTGLGLYIAYGLIKEHNGDISVFSKDREGTEFKIRLPIC